MTEVTKIEEQTPEAHAPAIISMIERVALNPDIDVDKMERLLQMQERIIERQAKADYTAALAEMQPKLPVIEERGKILNKAREVQSTFAKWEDINDAIKPILHEHGFALNFRVEERPESKIVVFAILSHRSGHSEETGSPLLMADTSGNKNAIQALGSSQSYGQRYTAKAILNLTSRGDDDDGQSGGAGPSVSPEQFIQLQDLLAELGSGDAAFLKHYNAPSLEQFPAAKFEDAADLLRHKLNTKKGAA